MQHITVVFSLLDLAMLIKFLSEWCLLYKIQSTDPTLWECLTLQFETFTQEGLFVYTWLWNINLNCLNWLIKTNIASTSDKTHIIAQ